MLNKQTQAEEAAPEIPLFADYAQQWYESYRTQVEESTYANYRYTLKLLNGVFGHLALNEVKVVQINQFINELAAKGYSSSQINKCRSMMIQILDMAEADDLVEKNYARRAFRTTKQLSKETKTHTKDAFTVEETARLLSDLPDDLMGNSIRLMLISGVRLQELLALTPRDIAEDGSWVRVNKAVKMVDGIPKLGDPKATPVAGLYPLLPNIGRFLSGCGKTVVKLFFGVLLGMKVYSTALEQSAANIIGCWLNTRMCVVCHPTAAAIPM